MRQKSILLFGALILANLVYSQSPLVVPPQDNLLEGGEIQLLGASNNNEWVIDNYQGHLRFHHSGSVHFELKTGGEISSGSLSSPIKFGKVANSSSGEGGEFILNGDGFNDWIVDNYLGRFRLHHSGQTRLLVSQTGHLGVNIPSPQAPLHVNTDGGAGIVVGESSSTGGFTALELGVSQKSGGYSYIESIKSSGAEMGDLILLPGNAGRVGIGTTDPGTAKLAVEGTIAAKEVIVEISPGQGPDYVFEEDYDLRTLEETKDYIQQNKHLPEIPSAKEMEENGIGLAEMNMKLLQKIEELTLHLIEQNVESQEQRQLIEALQKEVSALKNGNQNK